MWHMCHITAVLLLVFFVADTKCNGPMYPPCPIPDGLMQIYSTQHDLKLVVCNPGTTTSGRLASECDPGYIGVSEFTFCTDPDPRSANRLPAPCTEPNQFDHHGIYTVTRIDKINSSEKIGYYLECKLSTLWASGLRGQLTVCQDGNWTDIHDFCPADCPPITDCVSATDVGYMNSGFYALSPKNGSLTPQFPVWCEINVNSPDANGWMVALYTNFSDANNNLGAEAYKDLVWDNDYFIGIENLMSLNYNENGTKRPLVYLFEMVDTEGTLYHATYGSVQVLNNSYYTLDSVGSYHGNATDSFSMNVGLEFLETDMYRGWWTFDMERDVNVEENVTVLNSTKAIWPYLNRFGKTVAAIQLKVRPKDYDTEASCPPELKQHLWWSPERTSFVLPISRAVDITISFSCDDNFAVFGSSHDTQESGFISCRWSETLGNYWHNVVDFPCKINCSDGYIRSPDYSVCYHISQDTSKMGYFGAANKCAIGGATLAVINDMTILSNLEPDRLYYTAHTARNSDQVVVPELPVNCTPVSCTPSQEEQCLTVSQNGFEAKDCYLNSLNYICMKPAYCPPDFFIHKGRCFSMLGLKDTFSDALEDCASLEATLAYPEDSETLVFLAEEVRAASELDSQTIDPLFLGLNKMFGDWSGGGVYNPDTEFVYSLVSNDRHHWLLDVYTNDHETTPADFHDSIEGYAMCQYPGITECLEDPPAPPANSLLYWNSDDRGVLDKAEYICYPGYFVNGDNPLDSQTVECIAQLGGWYGDLQDCIAVDVCLEEVSIQNGATWIPSENPRHLNGTAEIICPPNLALASGQKSQNITCSWDDANGLYSFLPSPLSNCEFCFGLPTIENATTQLDPAVPIAVDYTITLTCLPGYSVDVGINTVEVECTHEGWNTANITGCYVACTEPPPEAGFKMDRQPVSSDAIGTVVQYSCAEKYLLQVTEDYPNFEDSTTLTCSNNHTWEPHNRPLVCEIICQNDPDPLPEGAVSSWDGVSKAVGTMAKISCTDGKLFGNQESSVDLGCYDWPVGGVIWRITPEDVDLTCRTPAPMPPTDTVGSVKDDGPYWADIPLTYKCEDCKMTENGTTNVTIRVIDGKWEKLNFNCYDATDNKPPPPSKGNDTVFLVEEEGPYWVSRTLNFSCAPNMSTNTGATHTTVTYTLNGWEMEDPDFTCLPSTMIPPPKALNDMTYAGATLVEEDPPYWSGRTLIYKCDGNKTTTTGETTINITYTDEGWPQFLNLSFICLDPNVPYVPLPTEPPVEFPDVNAEEQAYSDTADMHVASLNTAMEDVNGVPDNFGDTIGPFGFGKSVNLSSAQQQCLKKINYGPEGDCSMDPSLCTNGFSISIWEKAEFDEGHFYLVHKTDTENKRYIISTGGDEYGHPGLSLYHQGLALKAVVSTGDMFWTARAFGAVPPGVWTNLGIRWTQSFGLELYVNTRRVGQGKIGYTSTRQEPLNPSELIVGCHKTSSDPVYRDFNNAEFDELAIWTSALPDENLVYFLGGYNGEMKHLSPKEYEFMLKQTDMGDPRQAQRAFAVLGDISRDALKPVVIETTENETSSSTASENAAGATVGVSDRADRLQPWVDVVESMTSINNVKDELPSSEMPAFAGIIHPISNLMNESAAEDWERYQKENIGSPFVMKRMEEYLMYTMRNIRFKNQELSFSHVEVADNIVASMDKLLIRDYEYNGKFVTPNLKKIPEVREGWGGFSKAEIPNTLFKNHHCGTRPVNILSNLYKDLDHIAPMRLNPKTLNTGVRNALDSRVLSVNVIPDPPVYPGDSWCYPSQKQLQEDPLLLVLEHLNPQDVRPSRKLLFHENETLSDLAERHCVWWNARHGDLGAWDTEGCTKMESTVYFTKCTCSHFGVFSVMAEETETIEVPDEPFWLTIVRYTLYSISALCLILYIAVVGLSGDLKDQFHMTGLNLAAVLLAGSVFMIISDFESIRENRHACTIIGSFLHIFYLVAGGWIAVLGHAVFKSITSGIIQGLMNQYFLIPWGVTFMSFGLSYAAYLQDLGTDPRCFISWYNDVKHIFFFPLVICILVANFCAITIFFNLKTTALRGNPAMKEYMSFSIGGAVLVFYFTFTWIIGMFTYYQWESSSYIYPVFQIFNGLMGVVLLVCIGFLSSRFKMVLAGQAKRRKEMLMNMRKELSTKSDDKKKLHQRKGPKAKKVRDSQGEPPAASLRRPSNVDLEEERIGTWIPNEL